MKQLFAQRLTILALAAAPALTGCASTSSLPGEGPDQGKTIIYRDSWGVPHIYAPDVEAGYYAMGWAQAQDRPHRLLENLLMAMGEYASVAGRAAIPSDLRAHLWDHYGVARRGFETIDPQSQKQLRAFVGGINDYYRDHSQDRPSWWGEREVDPFMILAFVRLFLYNWSIEEAYGDLGRAGIRPLSPPTRGSNQFAVAPVRSAEGAAILAIDPHLSWTGPSRFWEFRIHAGELAGSGVTLGGAPYIGLGHNSRVAWAMTTGGPDTADVYELQLNPADPRQYLYDGEYRPLESRQVVLNVQGQEQEQFELLYSHHGPLIARQENRGYAARIAYSDVVRISEGWQELNLAQDYRDIAKALESLVFFPQNVMAADTSGNIYYQRTGRTPRRPDGYDWSKPVDGSTSKTEWTGFHPASDHLQLFNPPQGFLQNCNVPPDAMLPGRPFLPGDRPDYLYGSRQYGPLSGWTNQRGARIVQLLSADDSVTVDEAASYLNDVRPFGVERWQQALGQLTPLLQDQHPNVQAALQEVVDWNGELSRDSSAALKYSAWRQQLLDNLQEEGLRKLSGKIDDFYAVVLEREPKQLQLDEKDRRQLAQAFTEAMEGLQNDWGSLEAAYGDKFRVGRGDRSWPVGGGDGSRWLGLSTLRSLRFGKDRQDHTRWAQAGQSSTQLVVLTEPIQSWTYLPWGQSDRPDSPHYRDQAEQLFSPRQLKPSWWIPADLAPHVKSRTELPAVGQRVTRSAAP